MKRIILLIIVFLAINNLSEAQKFSKIAEIKINTDELSKTLQYQSTQMIFQSKQKTDFHYSYDIMDIIKPAIDSLLMILSLSENSSGVQAYRKAISKNNI